MTDEPNAITSSEAEACKPVSQIAAETGLSASAIYKRKKRGQPITAARRVSGSGERRCKKCGKLGFFAKTCGRSH